MYYSQFDPACAIPNATFNIVSSPDIRGTSDLFWSCIFTIVACTWTIQHLNIPAGRTCCRKKGPIKQGSAHSMWCDAKWFLTVTFWGNLKWMVLTILAPEFILGKAVGECVAALHIRDAMAPYAILDGVDWELTHCFFANMGGFTWIREEDPDQRYPPNRLSARTILRLRANRVITKLPDLSKAEILDKSKSNLFVKVIALVQVSWTIIQTIARAIKGLAVSQLELVTSAFCVCAVITYAFLLQKPQGVEVSARPLKLRRLTSEESQALHYSYMPLRGLIVPNLKPIRQYALGKIPNDFADDGEVKGWLKKNSATYAIGMALGGAIFGGIHVAGSYLEFPTTIERQVWHLSSILITVILPVSLSPVILHGWDKKLPAWVPWAFGTPWFIVCGGLYALARIFLLVETIRTLFFQPPSVFIGTWTTNIPHVT